MIRSLIYSITFHSLLILLTILSLPFMLREPIDLPPIVSVELIQITDKTSIPYAPKARKIIEETKKRERLVFATPLHKETDRYPSNEKRKAQIKAEPEEIKPQIRQSSNLKKRLLIQIK